MSFCIKEKEGNTLNKKMLHCTQEHHTDIRGEVVQPLEFCKDFFFINLNNSFIPIFKLIFIKRILCIIIIIINLILIRVPMFPISQIIR